MQSRIVKITLGAIAVLALVVGIGFGVATMRKTVTLVVDGQSSQASGFISTVSDALRAADITPGEHDVVTPGLDSTVANGATIDFRYGRPLEVTTDGVTSTYWTTETSLDAALARLGLSPSQDARLSEPTSRSLGRDGLALTITTPKAVALTVGGNAQQATTHTATVADLLSELKLTVGSLDRLSPAADTAVTEGMKVTLDRVTVTEASRTEAIAFQTTKQDDPNAYKGSTTTVTKGVAGSRTLVEKVTTVNGTVTSREVLSSTTTKEPVTAVVKVGTKALPPSSSSGGTGINLANEAMWDRIARCESGNRWNINTGNGYYGGLQFNLQTWRSVGGTDFAAYPHQATREQQITVANRLYAQRGLQPWSCKP